MKKQLERYFEINDENKFAYYTDKKGDKMRKQMDINKFECIIEYKNKLSIAELKTWPEKEQDTPMRVKILVPKGSKHREVFYYTDDLFEAELVKFEIEKQLNQYVRTDIYTANEIFRSNITLNIMNQIKLAPIRKDNWEKISSIAENYPDKFAEAMAAFGQKLVDKAKSMIGAPKKNRWMFEFKNLKQDIDKSHQANNSIKAGKLMVGDDGLQYISDSNPREGFIISDYDDIHAIICQKNKDKYNLNFKGRKMNVLLEDSKEVQDPMEKLLLSKQNRSNYIKKNLLVIVIKSVELGSFSKVPRNGEV